MEMVKIFYYELRRLLGNRFTVGLLLVALLYGYWTMRGEILLGIANTAPFSPWSFGAYLAEMMPLLLVALLCFLSLLTSDTGKRVEILIAATPLSQAAHCRIRYTAVTVAFLVVTAVPVVYAVGFYGIIFGAIDWSTLLLPLVITVFPPFLLVMGTGLWLGRVHHRLLMALVAVVLLLAVVPVPSWMDLYGGTFFSSYPDSLGVLDPPFQLPASVIAGKVTVSALGAGFVAGAAR